MGLIGALSGYTVKRSVAGLGAVALIIGEKIMRGRGGNHCDNSDSRT